MEIKRSSSSIHFTIIWKNIIGNMEHFQMGGGIVEEDILCIHPYIGMMSTFVVLDNHELQCGMC